MRSKVLFGLSFLFLLSLSIGVVKAQENILCVSCGDSCVTAEFASSALCNPPTAGDPICEPKGDGCILKGFEGDEGTEKVKICHFNEGSKEGVTLEVGEISLNAHLEKHGDYFGSCEDYGDIDLNKELGSGGAINRFDRFFDGIFNSDLENMKERFEEIRFLINEGRIDEAKELMVEFQIISDRLLREVSPDDAEKAKRLSHVITKAVKELENKLSKEDKAKFKKELQGKSNDVSKAGEIAGKIKALCNELKNYPREFYENCKTEDESSKWQKEMFRDLSEEQRKEAIEFSKIMKECFKTSGETCRCEDIPYPEFSTACSRAAPLAKACEVDKNEMACEELDELEMPELPDHLQDIFEEMEDHMSERFEVHMPKECKDAGANTPDECRKIMIYLNAPVACRDALENVKNEREGREICEKIMFELEAPDDCISAGIENFKDCGKYMFKNNADEKCLERWDGSGRDDWKKCDELIGRAGNGPGDQRGPNSGHNGPRIDFNCAKIKNSEERLNCFDNAANQVKSYSGFNDENYNGPCMTENDWKEKKKECRDKFGEHAGDKPVMGDSGNGYECVVDATCVDFGRRNNDNREAMNKCENKCRSNGQAWDFQDGQCKCFGGSESKDSLGKVGNIEGSYRCEDCEKKCGEKDGQRLRSTSCGAKGCECFYESEGPKYGPGEGPGVEADEGYGVDIPEVTKDVKDSSSSGGESSGGESKDDGRDEGGESSLGPSSEGSGGESSGGGISGNAFLNYYWKR